jgi:outer membrane protein OmpA-like peptidoglycan-associated protein
MFRVRAIFNLWLTTAFPLVLLSQHDPEYALTRCSVASEANDFSPFISGDRLYFVSDRADQLGVYFSAADSAARLTNIYSAERTGDTIFGKPAKLSREINFYNGGPCWTNSEGSRIWFSSNASTPYLLSPGKEKSRLRIFYSERRKKKWSERQELAFQLPDANYAHPFLTAGEDSLYFSSDMPGGFGGYDLYLSVRRDGSWSVPVNLGERVNSPGNDVFPSLFGGRLYFSSAREGGYGMLDLYECPPEGSPVNLKSPFNTESDDFGLAFSEDGKGYFSSSRSGNDDLYFFRRLFPELKNCQPYEKDKFCFTFFEEGEELEDSPAFEYQWSFGDGTVAGGKEARHCFPGYGEYLVELNIIDRSTNALFFNEASYPFTIEPSERLHLEGPDTVPPGFPIRFYAGNSSVPGYSISEFYWDVDNGRKLQAGGDELLHAFDSAGSVTVKMGVEAVSDETGNKEVFCVTKNVIVQRGAVYIPPAEPGIVLEEDYPLTEEDTITYTLFLAASDTLVNGLEMHPDKVVDVEQSTDSTYLYTLGKVQRKRELLRLYREAQEMGFKESRVTQIANDQLVEAAELSQTDKKDVKAIIEEIITDDQVVANLDVFYALNVAVLNEEQKGSVRKLVKGNPVKPGHRILIASFTDSKGNDLYNLDLSRRRSEAVRNELLASGYPAENIEIEYYGRRVPKSMKPMTDAKRRKSIILIYEAD